MLRPAILIGFALFILSTPMVHADQHQPEKSPEELVAEGMNTLMQAMKLFLHSLPQFGEPYINDKGDIVIPRVHPEKPGDKAPQNDEENKRRI